MTLQARASDGERHIIAFSDGWKGEMRLGESGSLLIKGDNEEAPTRYDPRRVDKVFAKKHGVLVKDQIAVVRKKRPEEEKEEEIVIEEDDEDLDIQIENDDQYNLEHVNTTMNNNSSKEDYTMLQTGMNTREMPTNFNTQNITDSAPRAIVGGAEPVILPKPQMTQPVKQVVPAPYSQTGALTVIQETISIEGNINAKSDVRINGEIKGNINSTQDVTITGKVVGDVKGGSVTVACNQDGNAVVNGNITSESELNIGKDSIVSGDVKANDALIQGAVKGSVNIENKIILDASAIVLGDIKAGIIVINEGARYSGKVIQTGGGETPEEYFKKNLKDFAEPKKEIKRVAKETNAEES